MSKTKFSKGKWNIQYGNGCKIYSNNLLVCLIKHGPNQTHGYEPNAQLIAVAPEMYKALSEIVKEIDSESGEIDLSDAITSMRDEIKQLLAKARGEE